MKITRKQRTRGGYLDGQLLVAMPLMTDRRFARSVIYMCAHSEEGAMGLIINQRAHHISFAGLLERLGIETASGDEGVANNILAMSVHVGGPVETGRGFVLHTSDYFAADSTLLIDSGVCLTATIDILKAIASGGGPNRSILALGYAGWAAGQLESEIQSNGWLSCPADADLIFDADLDNKYRRVLSKLRQDKGSSGER